MSTPVAATAASYNSAVRNLTNVKTSMLCKPWYVGNNLAYHIPNNWDITVDYKNGNVVVKEKHPQYSPNTPPVSANGAVIMTAAALLKAKQKKSSQAQ